MKNSAQVKNLQTVILVIFIILISFSFYCIKTGWRGPTNSKATGSLATTASDLTGTTVSKEDPIVKNIVEDYMTALKQHNMEKLISMSGIKMKSEMKEQIISGSKNFFNEVVDLDISSYNVKEIKVEGSIAFVTVEENRKIAPKESAPPGMDTGYRTVTETIVLIKRDGKWKIDGINTLHLSELDLDNNDVSMEQFNKMGVARLFSIAMDPDIAIVSTILTPNFLRARAQGQYTQCQSNLKNLGTALEMYSTDNSGHYPDSLGKLTPDYLRVIPTCASAGKDTYSETYHSTLNPDSYNFYCSGHNHGGVGVSPNYPQYNSTSGLVAR